MPKADLSGDFMREGYKSYHKALFAVMEFRKLVGDTIHRAVEGRLMELAAALKLSQAELRAGLIDYTSPDRLIQNFDGSAAEIGLGIPRNWKSGWRLHFYFWIGDKEELTHSTLVYAQVWLQEPGTAIEKLAAASSKLEYEGNSAWITEEVPADDARDLAAVCNRVLDRWIALWKKVGGLRQFLPSDKA